MAPGLRLFVFYPGKSRRKQCFLWKVRVGSDVPSSFMVYYLRICAATSSLKRGHHWNLSTLLLTDIETLLLAYFKQLFIVLQLLFED